MIGREFVRRLRWPHGRIEIVTNRFELDDQGRLVEFVTMEVQERPMHTASTAPPAVKSLGPVRAQPVNPATVSIGPILGVQT